MKKLPSTLPNMLCVLTLISVIAAGALAYVNEVTAGPIEENKARVLAEGINSVLGVSDAKVESTTEAEDANGNPVILYATDKGVAVQAIDPNGFGGKLKVLVGFERHPVSAPRPASGSRRVRRATSSARTPVRRS